MAAHDAKAAGALHGWRGRPRQRLRSFFVDKVWSVRLRDLGWGRALLYRLARIAYATVRGFFEHRLTVRAAALTYYSALSLVPFLAFAFAVLKGLGAYSAFVDNTLRPYIHGTFGGTQALVEASEQILRFVDRTNVSTLGTVGLVVLVYTSVSLLSSIEDALNEAWGVSTKRSPLRQLTNYVTLLVRSWPICVGKRRCRWSRSCSARSSSRMKPTRRRDVRSTTYPCGTSRPCSPQTRRRSIRTRKVHPACIDSHGGAVACDAG